MTTRLRLVVILVFNNTISAEAIHDPQYTCRNSSTTYLVILGAYLSIHGLYRETMGWLQQLVTTGMVAEYHANNLHGN